jgi:hypothetical protein
VPEVGNESIREVAHLVGTGRGAKTLFLMYTIFDDPLRLYADTMDAPIVAPEEIRPLSAEEEAELDDFIRRYMARNVPSREYREVELGPGRFRVAARHFAVRALWDRDNDYLRPASWAARDLGELVRGRLARALYTQDLPDRPFVYFPLQVADDYKILKLRPHCVHQEAIVEQVADALPPGVDIVVKEHPMSIGRNRLGMLRRLSKPPHIHLVDPRRSSLELAQASAGVVTISSSVGLEALLCNKPVLTLATPFYAGYGVTVDLEDLREISEKVPELLGFSPDRERSRRFLHAAMRRCYPGAPVLVDSSDENAAVLAATLDRAASGELS